MHKDLALLILRLPGLTLAVMHGWGKVAGLAVGQSRFAEGVAALGFPAPLAFAWAAALAEFVGGIFVALGLGTRFAAGFAAITMAVAAFGQHNAHGHLLNWLGIAPAPPETVKAWGNPELALTYLALFLGVALLGPGRLSLDSLVGKKTDRGRISSRY
jgi:putative oxidoreductase